MVIVVSFSSFHMSQLLERHLKREPKSNHITLLTLEVFIATLLNSASKFAEFVIDVMSMPIVYPLCGFGV